MVLVQDQLSCHEGHCMLRRLATALPLMLLLALSNGGAEAKSFKLVRSGIFALNTNLLMRAMAKELCSSWYVSRVGEGGPFLEGIEMGLERAQLPITPGLIKALTGVSVPSELSEIEVDVSLLGAIASLFEGEQAIASYNPEQPQFGCTLRVRQAASD